MVNTELFKLEFERLDYKLKARQIDAQASLRRVQIREDTSRCIHQQECHTRILLGRLQAKRAMIEPSQAPKKPSCWAGLKMLLFASPDVQPVDTSVNQNPRISPTRNTPLQNESITVPKSASEVSTAQDHARAGARGSTQSSPFKNSRCLSRQDQAEEKHDHGRGTVPPKVSSDPVDQGAISWPSRPANTAKFKEDQIDGIASRIAELLMKHYGMVKRDWQNRKVDVSATKIQYFFASLLDEALAQFDAHQESNMFRISSTESE